MLLIFRTHGEPRLGFLAPGILIIVLDFVRERYQAPRWRILAEGIILVRSPLATESPAGPQRSGQGKGSNVRRRADSAREIG